MYFEAYIICWNEARILPWVLNYWGQAGINKLIVYDNHSDDGTINILNEAQRIYNFQVEIRPYDSGGHADDKLYKRIKNSCWKGTDADWVFVGDTDEVLYTPQPLRQTLELLSGVDVIQPCGYQLVSWTLPHYDGMTLHTHADVRLQHLGPNKTNLFRPATVTEMNFGLGAHNCNPQHTGQMVYMPEISWFHLKNIGAQYLVERNTEIYARLPQKIKDENRIAVQYKPGMDMHNVARDLADMWLQARPYQEFETLKYKQL